MGMNIPIASPAANADPGPDYANNINANLFIADAHDHTTGKGLPITPAAIDINSDLLFGGFNAIGLRSTRFNPQGTPLSGVSDIGLLSNINGDAYWNNGAGVPIRLTQNGQIVGPNAAFPMFNVKAYGATGNGSTDDTAAIQACLNAASNGTVYFPPGTYVVSSTLVIANAMLVQFACMRGPTLKWTGGASPIIHITNAADNVQIDSSTFENTGSATHAVLISCIRALVSRSFTNPTVAFSTAIVSTDTTATTYQICLRDSAFFSSAVGQVNPIGFYGARGHTMVVDNCMFSGCHTGVLCGGAGGNSVTGFSIINSRIETFSGQSAGHPGGATDIGVDVANVNGLNLSGCNFEMDGDGDISASGQRAIRFTASQGGSIRGNYITGNGCLVSLINIAASTASGNVIEGNSFFRFGAGGGAPGFAVEQTGSGSVWANQIGENFVWDTSSSGSFNNTFTPVLKFGGATTGITYAIQAGRAQRVGKWIIGRAKIVLSSKGSATGNASITGLPITADANTTTGYFGNFEAPATVFGDTLSTITGAVVGYVSNNSQTILVFQSGTGGLSALTNANFNNGSLIDCSFVYEANF